MRRFRSTAFLSAALFIMSACASQPDNTTAPPNLSASATSQSPNDQNGTFSDNELAAAISDHLGVTAESAASAIERVFREQGRPVGYITGEEGGGAFTVGLRFGKGTLWMKDGRTQNMFWQGPTIGFDIGAEVSKVFVLVYNLPEPSNIYQRFPGVDGSAFLVAGLAVNYQRSNGIVLAPVRSGVGVRLGANIGYTSYTRKRSLIPL